MFLTHLRKDLRQAAPTFAALFFLVLVGSVGFTAYYFYVLHPEWDFDVTDFAWRVAAVAGVAAMLALGDSVVPENREGNASLVARLPGGLLPSYVSRGVVLVVGTALTTALAYDITGGTCVAIGERLQFGTDWSDYAAMRGRTVLAAMLGALWTLALVGGMRRGGLAFPAALIVGAAVVLPIGLVLREAGVWERTGDRSFAYGVLVVAAAFAGWEAFRGTFRWSRGPWAGAWRGVVASLLLSLPIQALGALRHHQWTTVDEDDALTFHGGVVSTDQRRVYLTASRRWEWPREQGLSLVIDLERGTLEAFDGMWAPAGFALRARGFDRRPQPVILLMRNDSDWAFVDTGTGETIHRTTNRFSWAGLPTGVRETLADVIRRTAPIELADGRPAWISDGRLQSLDVDERLDTLPLPDGFVPRRSHARWLWAADRSVLDLHTMDLVEGTESLRSGLFVTAICTDGLLMSQSWGGYNWLAAGGGPARPLELSPADEADSRGFHDSFLRMRDGRFVLRHLRDIHEFRYMGTDVYLFDPIELEARRAGPRGAIAIATCDDGSILAVMQYEPRIIRIDPDTNEVETLFPKPD